MKMKRLIVLLYVFFLPTFGCVSIPDTSTVEDRPQKFDLLPTDNLCHPELVYSHQIPSPAVAKGIDPSGFSLLSWNIQKENRKGWDTDLARFSQNADIVIIQEAYLTEDLRRLLLRRPYYWHLVTAFEYQEVKAGVLTAATIEPDFICPLRMTEPLIRFPKSILITRYPLTDTPYSLMIANIHLINFTPHITTYGHQVRQLTEILVNHQGPMILAGDFNTWSEERLAIIEEVAARLSLVPATFKTDRARKVFGYTVDRVYYRGLTLQEASVIEVNSSDHNPLWVRFKLKDGG
ncbi:MAG: endonuclease/exonuclease/phosphatase family protein [Desulfobacterales bacterium]|jgi:endonuclease/exonuclease/phosphatase (EEP) superfamily protein YafD